MTNLNLRFRKKTDILPSMKDGDSLYSYVQDNNGGSCKISGMIGSQGSKSHVFYASYITVNEEKIIVSYYSICGAESYKTAGLQLLPIGSEVTCKKCQKHHN